MEPRPFLKEVIMLFPSCMSDNALIVGDSAGYGGYACFKGDTFSD